jgi:hypothetical protein
VNFKAKTILKFQMGSFKLSFVLCLALAAVSSAKKCSLVPECADYEFSFDKTISQNIISDFNQSTPQDGVCLDGKTKVIFQGSDFGFEEN